MSGVGWSQFLSSYFARPSIMWNWERTGEPGSMG